MRPWNGSDERQDGVEERCGGWIAEAQRNSGAIATKAEPKERKVVEVVWK